MEASRAWWVPFLRGVAFAAILLAIFLFAKSVLYGDYLERSRVTEAFHALAPCQAGVAQVTEARKAWPANAAEAGCGAQDTKYASAPVVRDGRVEITFKDLHPELNGRVLTLQAMADAEGKVRATPDKPILAWHCATNAEPRNYRHFPPPCRNAP